MSSRPLIYDTDSMNISGAVSIQTATIGGTANGSYVDSDKFKECDINFHLQVKVTNQILHGRDYSLFIKLQIVDDGDFTAVYGVSSLNRSLAHLLTTKDSFISG